MPLYLPPSLLLIAFLEGFSTVPMERGIYSHAHRYPRFSDALSLALALAFGACVVPGAPPATALAIVGARSGS